MILSVGETVVYHQVPDVGFGICHVYKSAAIIITDDWPWLCQGLILLKYFVFYYIISTYKNKVVSNFAIKFS